jgi:gamma-glutamyl-gamma-aminobutyraldehyde dehydrogenase
MSTLPTSRPGKPTRWSELAEQIEFRCDVYIDGEFVAPLSGARFPSIDPATERTLAMVAAGDERDIDRAATSARTAFEAGAWSQAEPQHRKEVLLRLAALVEEHIDELAITESLDTGKLVAETRAMDMPGVVEAIRWYAEAIDKVYGEVGPTGLDDVALVTREPLGVVGAVVPWNFPLQLASWKVAPALACGNSVVLKPAEQSSLTALRFAELATQAGLPPGALNVVPGIGERAGKALGLHPDVDCVCFTGSTEVGKLFLQYSGQSNMKQIWLECGGKSPNMVFADAADLDRAAESAAQGIFFNQGQVCSASSRLLVQKPIKDEFLARVLEQAGRFSPGNPLDERSTMGALIDRAHTDTVLRRIGEGRADAKLILGGEATMVDGRGCFVAPTIFDDVPPTSKIAQEEVFGPVLAVIGFEDDAEAVRLANDTTYGLAASIWTSDLRRALRVARAIRVGTVSVNAVDRVSLATPFGGFKQSGIGRDLSLHALDKYTALKTTWIDLR